MNLFNRLIKVSFGLIFALYGYILSVAIVVPWAWSHYHELGSRANFTDADLLPTSTVKLVFIVCIIGSIVAGYWLMRVKKITGLSKALLAVVVGATVGVGGISNGGLVFSSCNAFCIGPSQLYHIGFSQAQLALRPAIHYWLAGLSGGVIGLIYAKWKG